MAARGVELLHQVKNMRFDRSHADAKLRGDLLVRTTTSEMHRDFALAGRKRCAFSLSRTSLYSVYSSSPSMQSKDAIDELARPTGPDGSGCTADAPIAREW